MTCQGGQCFTLQSKFTSTDLSLIIVESILAFVVILLSIYMVVVVKKLKNKRRNLSSVSSLSQNKYEVIQN